MTFWAEVAQVIVDAVDGRACRLISHISQEVFKLHPVWANGDAATAVVFPSLAFGIEATLDHTCPGIVFRGVCLTVGCIVSNHTVAFITAARNRIAAAKI